MKLRLTEPAARQLDQVLQYIFERNPRGARKVQARLQQVMNLLLEHPEVAPLTQKRGLRRIVAVPYPYAIFYRVAGEDIIISAIRHTARRTLV